MQNSYSDSYKAAGVDVTAGYKAVELMRSHVARTMTGAGALGELGGFGGLLELDLTGMPNPVLCAGTDGVGTKLKLAFLMDKHDTVGIDCVAMCVNDIICTGAKPLLFLDYIALGKNIPEKVASIVAGVAEGCVQAGCVLSGGETAEMPGFYAEDEYDLAGFAVGAVDKSRLLKNENVKAGDLLVGIASSGVHSNGFSLVRKVFDVERPGVLDTHYDALGGTLGEALLAPTKIYVKPVLSVIEHTNVKAISHITGGGFYENIPRALPKGKRAMVSKHTFTIPALFDLIQKTGNIPEHDMFNTFNMGIGMVLIVDKQDAQRAVEILGAQGERAAVIGYVADGEHGVELC